MHFNVSRSDNAAWIGVGGKLEEYSDVDHGSLSFSAKRVGPEHTPSSDWSVRNNNRARPQRSFAKD